MLVKIFAAIIGFWIGMTIPLPHYTGNVETNISVDETKY